MTNGEKIKAMFPSMIVGFITESQIGIYFVKNQHSATVFDSVWWNAEYKGSTTKNNLGVDCVARQDVERYIEGFINEYTSREELEFINLELDGLKHIPSVTPIRPKGHWLMPDKNYSDKIWRKCSCCGTHLEKFSKYVAFNGSVHYIENIMNYCHICGAEMSEVKE